MAKIIHKFVVVEDFVWGSFRVDTEANYVSSAYFHQSSPDEHVDCDIVPDGKCRLVPCVNDGRLNEWYGDGGVRYIEQMMRRYWEAEHAHETE